MTVFTLTRPTIYQAPQNISFEDLKSFIPDSGRRRLRCSPGDFDTRAAILKTIIKEDWTPEVKATWRNNQDQIKQGLAQTLGENLLDEKIDRFIEIDTKPFSILSYHNEFFSQVRTAYVMGLFYPALVGACALGERILNHLIIDMRSMFQSTPEYKKVYRKNSFDKWSVPIETLESWGVFLPSVAGNFEKLSEIRNRSIHFNVSTYETLRDDAISAILCLREIIEQQFGTWGTQPWFIHGTKGAAFVAKEFESHPFVITYFAPRFAYVGPLFGVRYVDGTGYEIMDMHDYGDGEWTDEEFAEHFNNRDPDQVITEPLKFRWEPETPV